MSEQQTQQSSFVVPLLAGLAGFALAMLLAPRSGQETRLKMQQSANDLKQQARDKMTQTKSQAESKINQAKTMKDNVTDAIKTTKETAKKEADDLNEVPPSRDSAVLTSWDREA